MVNQLLVFSPSLVKADDCPLESGSGVSLLSRGRFSWPTSHLACSDGSVWGFFSDGTKHFEMPLVVLQCCINTSWLSDYCKKIKNKKNTSIHNLAFHISLMSSVLPLPPASWITVFHPLNPPFCPFPFTLPSWVECSVSPHLEKPPVKGWGLPSCGGVGYCC